MKDSITFIKIIIEIIFLFNNYSCTYANDDIIKVDIQNDFFDIFLQIINVIMIIINFAFVVFVFIKERQESQKERLMQYDEYWYNRYVLDRNMELINDFFSNLTSLETDLINHITKRNNTEQEFDLSEYSQMVFERWTEMHNDCKSKFCEKIDVVMPDFSKELRNVFIELQDFVANKINEILLCFQNEKLGSLETEFSNTIIEYKKELIKRIYLKGKKLIY